MPEVAPAEGQERTPAAEMPAEAVSMPEEEAVLPETEPETGAAPDGEEAVDAEDAFTPHAPAGHTRLVTEQGLTADQYAVSKPWLESDRLSEEEEAEIGGVEIEYDLKREEVAPGLRAFQRRVSFKKHMIYTAILLVVAALYAQAVWTRPDYDLGKVMFGISVFVLFMLWFLPWRHIQATVKAIESDPARFKLTVTPVGILLPEDGGQYLIRYSAPEFAAVELENAFTLCVSREKVFILPKRCVPPEKMDEVRQMLKDGLRERYAVK